MKCFYELPLIESSPAMALHIEDGLPACVRMNDYEGPRGMSEILAKSAPASDIKELHAVAASLSCPAGHQQCRCDPCAITR